ncbi:MAG: aminopeptidase P family protein [Alphaproteobacteria bacterium]|nr:aminopeptidase P family protein [Alphaproteobacteria bacterium]
MNNCEIVVEFVCPEPNTVFAPIEYRSRLEKVRAAMHRAGIDLLYAASPESLFYLSGYQALWYQTQVLENWVPIGGIAVHVDHEEPILFDSEGEKSLCRYTTVTRDVRILDRRDMALMDFVVDQLKREGWTKGVLGLEMYSSRPPRAISEQFQTKMEAAGIGRTVDATAIVNHVRHIKSPQELAFTRTAGRIAEVGLEAARRAMRPGVTEIEVWGEVMRAVAQAGGENPSITLPVDAGPKSAVPHSLPSRRVICRGDIVNVDVCAVYNRYHSDCSRSFSIGAPLPQVAAVIEKSARSFDILLTHAKVGRPVQEACDALKAYYKEAGLWGDQWWTGGYELGCAFPPSWVGPWSYDVDVDNGAKIFESGMVVNYESDFYLPHAAGMSLLIDTLVFEGDDVQFNNRLPKDLIVVE